MAGNKLKEVRQLSFALDWFGAGKPRERSLPRGYSGGAHLSFFFMPSGKELPQYSRAPAL
jgi:hypothetical protein